MNFSISVIIFFKSVISVQHFLIFSIFLLKLSLCSSIVLLTLVNIFMIIILNSQSDKSLISVTFRSVSGLLFCLGHIYLFSLALCVCFCELGKTATSLNLDRVVLHRRGTLSIRLTLSCLSNICDCLSCLLCSWLLPVVEGM